MGRGRVRASGTGRHPVDVLVGSVIGVVTSKEAALSRDIVDMEIRDGMVVHRAVPGEAYGQRAVRVKDAEFGAAVSRQGATGSS